jgi:hypothetical protein
MAITSVTARGTGNSTTSGTTVGATPIASGSIGANNVVIAVIGKDNLASANGETTEISGVADTNSNTYAKAAEYTNSEGGAGLGATVGAWIARVTSALDNTDTTTATFGSAVDAKTIGILDVVLGAGNTLQVADHTVQADSTTTGFTGSLSGLPSKEYLWLLIGVQETTGASAATVTGYTAANVGIANTGTNSTSISTRIWYKIATGTGETPAMGGTINNADKAFLFMALEEVADGAVAAVTGTAGDGCTESQIVAGGQTIILTLTNDTWVAAGGTFDGQRQNIIDGIDSAQSEAAGWDAQRSNIAVTDVARTSDTVVTITLPALAGYSITANETITATIPATALVGNTQLVASPTFTITAESQAFLMASPLFSSRLFTSPLFGR